MAVTVVFNKYGTQPKPAEYSGLSTDTKPIEGVDLNALFLELDTNDWYYFDGTEWQPVGG